MKWTVDRIEEGYAVVETEDMKICNIPIEAIGMDISEGDIIILQRDENETQKQKDKVSKLMDSLFVD